MARKSAFLSGKRIDPKPIHPSTSITELIDNNFVSYNAGRLREACQLFTGKILEDNVTVGLSLSGALTPAGLAISALVPLIENGFIDWIVSTGANLYHDTHFAMGMPMHRGTPNADDVTLREEGIVRIYDIFFDYDILISTDYFFREILKAPEFQKEMSTSELHFRVGRYLAEREKILGTEKKSLLAAAYKHAVPI
ncbi:MAG: deoxyhypusine synthase family protein, partial [Deltaproteobacteria bacterium]|nr:deoxyhypusine synthase family protein [Deltaproteobacteria bacterium]